MWVFLGLVSACAAPTQTIAPDSPASPQRIVPSELLDVVAGNAYDVVRQLRPQWLRSRGPTSVMEPRGELPSVYVDNMMHRDLEVLRDIPLSEILEMRFVNGPDATNRWGTGFVAGVIEVVKKSKN